MSHLSGRRVLVSGHTGFKGTWLSLWLDQLGAEVWGLSLPAEVGSLYDRAALSGRWPEVLGDIRDQDVVTRALRQSAPDLVMHLAAQPLVRKSYRSPVATWGTNVMGTTHVLDGAVRCDSVHGVVVVTTDKVYLNTGQLWGYREPDPLGGHDPYSASKSAAEMAAQAWRSVVLETGGPQIVTVRAGNVIGGGDFAADRLLPDLMRGFAAGDSVAVRNPASTRPWQHVLDPLSGYLRVAELLVTGATVPESLNFGPDPKDVHSVQHVCDIASDSWGPEATWQATPDEGPAEADALALDSTLAARALGWSPRWTTTQAVDRTVGWWKSVLSGVGPEDACREDLLAFERRS